MIAAFLDELEKQERLITDFDTGLWNAVIESMTIYSKEHIVFKFKGGTEIKWSIDKQEPHRETKTVIFCLYIAAEKCLNNFFANGRKQSETIAFLPFLC